MVIWGEKLAMLGNPGKLKKSLDVTVGKLFNQLEKSLGQESHITATRQGITIVQITMMIDEITTKKELLEVFEKISTLLVFRNHEKKKIRKAYTHRLLDQPISGDTI